LSKKAEGFSLRFVLINTGNISRKVLSKVLRSFDKNFERLQRGGNDYKSVLEILNIYQAVGDMHFIGERDYFNKIEKKLEKELETGGGSL